MTRVLVVGLDSFSPDLVDRWLDDLPNLASLMQRGIHGPMQSIVQPVTPAAWTAMISGLNPGHFGFTDFPYRVGHSYTEFKLVHSRLIKVPTLPHLCARENLRAAMVGVPVSYPPVPIPNGVSLSCFMAPSLKRSIVHPPQMQEELLAQTSSPFVLDASLEGVPSDDEIDREQLRHSIREYDRQRFDITRYLLSKDPWDLLFMVAMGPDRAGHHFMRYLDPQHGCYEDAPRLRDVIRDQYRYCDERLGELVELAGPETVVMVVSDHGIQRLDGKLNINDWLAAEGLLVFDETPDTLTPLAKASVSWSRTRAWARGYGGQIYLNLHGREAEGCVEPAEAEALLANIEARLRGLRSDDGQPLRMTTLRRSAIYDGPQAERCPDLFVQIEDLRILTSDLVGHGRMVTPASELGPDDASHAMNGFCALAGPGVPQLGRFAALQILDVAPTVLDLLGVEPPPEMEGRAIHLDDDVYSEDDESELTSRLQALYLE